MRFLGFYTRAYVRHLEDEIVMWRTMWKHERQRQELAVERLLAKSGTLGVVAPLIPDDVRPPSDEDQRFAEEMESMGRVPVL